MWRCNNAYLLYARIRQQCLHGVQEHRTTSDMTVLLRGLIGSGITGARANSCCRDQRYDSKRGIKRVHMQVIL
jgi:hypothetical protein